MGDSALHSELSPSKRHRWGACPGSIREEAKFPEKDAGKAALDGTRSHALLEECIKGNVYVVPDFVVGTERTDEHGKYVVDADRVDRVNLALAYVKRQALEAKTTPIAESRVHPDGLVGRADMHGTIDIQIPGVEVYEVIDYKDGVQPVDAEYNPQMVQYALGVLAGLETPPHSFRITIIQPKNTLKGLPTISTWVVSTAALLDVELPRIVKQAAATNDPNAPLVPGEAQCKYCRAKATCPALGKAMNEVFSMYGPVIDVEAETVSGPQAIAQKDSKNLSDDELRRIMTAAPLVRQLIDAVEKEIQSRLEKGTDVPGFKLVNGRGSRDWALGEDEIVKVLTGMGVPKANLYESKLVSVAKAEKLTWDKKGEPQKLSDKQIKRLAAEYITHRSGKPTVAPEADPRPAVVYNAAPLYAPVAETPSLPPFLAALPPGMAAPLQDLAAQIAEPTPAPIPDWMAIPSWMK